jgi:hypothetical protein
VKPVDPIAPVVGSPFDPTTTSNEGASGATRTTGSLNGDPVGTVKPTAPIAPVVGIAFDPTTTSNAGAPAAGGTTGTVSREAVGPVNPIAPIAPVVGIAFDPTATSNAGVTAAGIAIGTVSSDPAGPVAPILSAAPVSFSPGAGGAGQINQANLLGEFDNSASWKFLATDGRMTSAGAPGSPGTNIVVVQAGGSFTQQFNIALGDKLDLTQVLAGAPISQDLTNLSQFVRVVGHGANDPGYGHGTKTTLEITGPSGSARVDLQGSGRLDLKDLLHHDSFLLPPS